MTISATTDVTILPTTGSYSHRANVSSMTQIRREKNVPGPCSRPQLSILRFPACITTAYLIVRAID
jgi:hypothetical protein